MFWHILVYFGVYWRILAHDGIFWHISEYFGIFWCILVYLGVFWRMMAYFGIFRHMLAYFGVFCLFYLEVVSCAGDGVRPVGGRHVRLLPPLLPYFFLNLLKFLFFPLNLLLHLDNVTHAIAIDNEPADCQVRKIHFQRQK